MTKHISIFLKQKLFFLEISNYVNQIYSHAPNAAIAFRQWMQFSIKKGKTPSFAYIKKSRPEWKTETDSIATTFGKTVHTIIRSVYLKRTMAAVHTVYAASQSVIIWKLHALVAVDRSFYDVGINGVLNVEDVTFGCVNIGRWPERFGRMLMVVCLGNLWCLIIYVLRKSDL